MGKWFNSSWLMTGHPTGLVGHTVEMGTLPGGNQRLRRFGRRNQCHDTHTGTTLANSCGRWSNHLSNMTHYHSVHLFSFLHTRGLEAMLIASSS